MLVAIVLAAGRSSRMGRAKALLLHADGTTTFVAHVIGTCRDAGLLTVIVVGRSDDLELQRIVERHHATFVANSDPDRGQLSSLVVGLDAAERQHGADAIVVLPVDVPMITTTVITRLVTAAASTASPIVRASAGGKHGHPVIFKRAVFDELRGADPALGARAVVRAHPERVADIDVGEAGVTIDVDTPEDYRRTFGRSV